MVTEWLTLKIDKSMNKKKFKTEEDEAHERWRQLIQQLIGKEMVEK